MNLKSKRSLSVLASVLLASVALTSCSSASSAVASSAASSPAVSSATSAAVTKQTSDTNKVVTIGEIPTCEAPVYITSIGQSADASMLDALMKKAGATYTFNSTATAEDIKDVKTLIIAAGASSKGLGAAGISEDSEKARAAEILQVCKDNNIKVIMAHLGGASRRGPLSDEFTDIVLDSASYLMVVEDGNADGKFTSFAKEKNIPITLIRAIADTMEPLKTMFPA